MRPPLAVGPRDAPSLYREEWCRVELTTRAHSTHQDDERHIEVLVFSAALSRQRRAIADYRLSCRDAQPASLVSLTLCVLPRTMTMMVPEMPYSRL